MRTVRFALVLGLIGAAFLVTVPASASHGGLPSRVVLLSDHSTPVKTWSPLPVRVRLETAEGVPLAGKNMRIWDDSYMRWRCCGPPPWRTTDANGEVSATLHLDGNSANPVRVAAYWHGNDVYESAIVEWYQPMLGYQTTLDVAHAAQLTSGQTMPVTVAVSRTDPDRPTGCMDGAIVEIELTGPVTRTATAVVEDDGQSCGATVDMDMTITPGLYTLTASTGHAGWLRTDEPSVYTGTVNVRWQNTFADARGRGTALLNVATKDYRIILADGRDSGVRNAGPGMTRTGVTGSVNVWRIDLNHAENGESAAGTFYSTGLFSAHGVLHGAPWSLER